MRESERAGGLESRGRRGSGGNLRVAVTLLPRKPVQRDMPSGFPGQRLGEVTRESENFRGRTKDEQQGPGLCGSVG